MDATTIKAKYGVKNGHTILEVFVVTLIFTIAVILTATLFKFGLNSFRDISMRAETQRKTLIVLNKINMELEASTIESLSFYYNNAGNKKNLAISFLSPFDNKGSYSYDSNKVPLYQAYIIYFLDEKTNTIRRIRVPLSVPSSNPTSLTEEEIKNKILLTSQKIEDDVESFQALDCQTKNLLLKAKNPFILEIKAKVDNNKIKSLATLKRTYRLIK